MKTENTELSISRLIKAPPVMVWRAWNKPELLQKWWIPRPLECRVIKLDLRPGGAFETQMREGEDDFKPHVEACFLEIVPERRIVWTTTLVENWQPAEPWLALTAIITFEAEGNGTRYAARVLHKNAEDTSKHEQMGFQLGWGTTISQLAAVVETDG
ncbi:MAG: SRPBCC family protein [Alphaproteobacteria bacterium]|nr:SRPBCC family protein [Alphaproteobacteria bacterium]